MVVRAAPHRLDAGRTELAEEPVLTVIVHLDSSALLKRVVAEAESRSLSARIPALADDGAALLTSFLAWVEVSRALRRAPLPSPVDAARLADLAMSGVATAAQEAGLLVEATAQSSARGIANTRSRAPSTAWALAVNGSFVIAATTTLVSR